ARLMTVYEYGGIYMDTDVEVIKPLDDLLENKAYMSFENNENVNTGQGFGAEAGLPFLKEHIDVYRNWQFINPDGSYNQIGCPKVATDLFRTKGIKLDGTEQTVCDVHIYPAEYFNPYDSITGKLTKTENTYSIHWYDASWSGQSAAQLKVKRFIRRIIGKEKAKKLANIKNDN
ncbi:MAG: glycosyl transferase, partial [Clostridiales bacterium]|nr:glycosyl transferase [Clostridiales bacterium]